MTDAREIGTPVGTSAVDEVFLAAAKAEVTFLAQLLQLRALGASTEVLQPQWEEFCRGVEQSVRVPGEPEEPKQ